MIQVNRPQLTPDHDGNGSESDGSQSKASNRTPKNDIFFSDEEADNSSRKPQSEPEDDLPIEHEDFDPWGYKNINQQGIRRSPFGQEDQEKLPPLIDELNDLIVSLENKGFNCKSVRASKMEKTMKKYRKSIMIKRNEEIDDPLKRKMRKRRTEIERVTDKQSQREYEDFIIINDRRMRFLSGTYGEVVYLYRLKNHPRLRFLSNFMFSGSNFAQKPIFFGNILCRREDISRYYKMFYIFIVNFLPNIKTLIVEKMEEEVIFALRKIRDKNRMDFKIVSPGCSEACQVHTVPSLVDQMTQYSKATKNPNTKIKRSVFYQQKQNMSHKEEYNQMMQFTSLQRYISESNHSSEAYVTNECYVGINTSLGVEIKALIKENWDQVGIQQSCENSFQNQYLLFCAKVKSLFKMMVPINEDWFIVSEQYRPINEYFKYGQQLNFCRNQMPRISFDLLVKELISCQKLSVSANAPNFCLVDDGSSTFTVEKWETTRYLHNEVIINKICQCQCGYRQRSGIPCGHMLKVMQMQGIKLTEAIEPTIVINQVRRNEYV